MEFAQRIYTKVSLENMEKGSMKDYLNFEAAIWTIHGLGCLFLPDALHFLKEDLSDQSKLFMQFIGIFEALIAALLYQIGKEGTQSLQQNAFTLSKWCLVASSVLVWWHGDMYAHVYVVLVIMIILLQFH